MEIYGTGGAGEDETDTVLAVGSIVGCDFSRHKSLTSYLMVACLCDVRDRVLSDVVSHPISLGHETV